MSERPDEPEAPEAGYTPDQVPARRIGAWVFAFALVLAVTLVGLYELVLAMSEREVYVRQLRPVSPELVRQRDREESTLGRYEVVDEKRGRYRIPITRAMELLVAEPARLRPAPPASAPATTPASTPASRPEARRP